MDLGISIALGLFSSKFKNSVTYNDKQVSDKSFTMKHLLFSILIIISFVVSVLFFVDILKPHSDKVEIVSIGRGLKNQYNFDGEPFFKIKLNYKNKVYFKKVYPSDNWYNSASVGDTYYKTFNYMDINTENIFFLKLAFFIFLICISSALIINFISIILKKPFAYLKKKIACFLNFKILS